MCMYLISVCVYTYTSESHSLAAVSTVRSVSSVICRMLSNNSKGEPGETNTCPSMHVLRVTIVLDHIIATGDVLHVQQHECTVCDFTLKQGEEGGKKVQN